MSKEICQIPYDAPHQGELSVGILALNPKDGKGRVLIGERQEVVDRTAVIKEFSLTPVQLSLIRILDNENGKTYETIANEYLDTPAHNLAMILATTETARNNSELDNAKKDELRKKIQSTIDDLLNGETTPTIGIRNTELPSINTIRSQIWHLRQKIGKEAITRTGNASYRLTMLSEIPKLPVPETMKNPILPFFWRFARKVTSYLPHSRNKL